MITTPTTHPFYSEEVLKHLIKYTHRLHTTPPPTTTTETIKLYSMHSKPNLLQKKQNAVLQLLSTEQIQEKLANPTISAVSLTFPITNLIKKQKFDTNPSLLSYSLTSSGFKDWYA